MLRTIILLIGIFGASFAISAQETDNTATETLIHIAPQTQECTGVGLQDCLIVRFEDDDFLSYFYDSINGFEFEAGFEYTLNVSITERENPPADASSLQYDLIEVVQQFPAGINNKLWQLQVLNGVEIEDPTQYDLILLDDGLAIQADCNRVRADIELEPFSIETTISTRAACAPDSLEGEYLQALNNAIMYSIENGELLIQNPEGMLRFAPPSITDITWQLDSATRDDISITADDVVYSLQFVDDRASMIIACNQAGADVLMDGAIIEFGELETEEELCEDDPLSGLFPPTEVSYAINADNQLILESTDGTRYIFNATVTE